MAVIENVETVIRGKREVVELVVLSLVARGHVLLEDLPGTGKTTLVSTLARSIDCGFNRIQFTPDIMPSDVSGFSIFNQKTREFEFRPGGVMSNLVLADEINRASAKTQSALLEAMEEGNVTVDGVTHPVPDPFIVIATQNPVGASGTQLLPDSQLDRFMVRLSMGYPRPSDELELLSRKQKGNPLDNVRCIADRTGLAQIREVVDQTYINPKILEYIIRLGNDTQPCADPAGRQPARVARRRIDGQGCCVGTGARLRDPGRREADLSGHDHAPPAAHRRRQGRGQECRSDPFRDPEIHACARCQITCAAGGSCTYTRSRSSRRSISLTDSMYRTTCFGSCCCCRSSRCCSVSPRSSRRACA